MRVWLAVLALAAWPGVASAGWRGAEWGMTPEQVAQALPGDAPLSKGSSGDRLGGKTIGNVGRYQSGQNKFKTVFYYDDRGLQSVLLDPANVKNCQAIAVGLVGEFGDPVRISDQIILKIIIWHDTKAGNRVRLLVSTSVCTLYYERLSDFEAIDKAPH